MTDFPKVSRNWLYTLSKLVFSSSSLLMKNIVGNLRFETCLNARNVPVCTPSLPSTTINALSATANPASISCA